MIHKKKLYVAILSIGAVFSAVAIVLNTRTSRNTPLEFDLALDASALSFASRVWRPGQQALRQQQQRHLNATIAFLAAQEAAELAREGLLPLQNSSAADVPWTPFNSSQAVPLLPASLAWLLYEAEKELANHTSGGIPFQLERAAMLARYTSVVYCNTTNIQRWNCTRCKRAGHMTVYATVFDPIWDLMAYAGYSSTLGAKVVVFRGTDSHSLYNWVENMRYWRTDISIPFPNATGALVHAGFLASYNMSALRTNLTAGFRSMQKWHPWAPTYVIGHSLGGALATLCALDLKYTFVLKDVRVYTFGSPRVGNAAFADYFDTQIPESFRMTHNRDLVPSVPLQLMGFHHVPREVWQIDFNGHSVITECDPSGEDVRCHDSMCYLGLCTSIADHLSYLGAHMYHSDTGC